ncbi:MAG: uroporphyrinogen decarboxylase family protein [Thermoproteota archaeon]
MATLNRIERVYRALKIEEADKVPKGELGIHDELVSALLGEPSGNSFEAHVRVRRLLNMDLVNLGLEGGPRVELIGVTKEGYPIYRNWLGVEWVESGKTRSYLKHALSTAEDMEHFCMPDINLFNTTSIRRWVEQTDFCVFAQVGGVFDSIYPYMGLTNYVKALYLYPNALRHVIEEVYRFNLEVIKMFAEAGAHVILVGDDIAYDNGPFIPPSLLRKYVFPYLAGEAEAAHRLNLPVILHSDGNIMLLIEDIVKAGFDGLHSLQPSAGVDIVAIKKRWGSRLCLMGNVDLDSLLTLGIPEDVEAEVKRLIREVAPGGGYILSTTNVLTRYVPPENALAMYRAAEKYGQYPINI